MATWSMQTMGIAGEKALQLQDLGRMDYVEALELMRRLAEQRANGEGVDTLLIVEHPEVITLGRRRGARDNVLVTDVPVVEVERGGDVTWHGPGQVVGYPVILLGDGERDVHAVLRHLEDAIIATLAELGLAATRKPGHTGVWSPPAPTAAPAPAPASAPAPAPASAPASAPVALFKVASLGIAITRWVTTHGFALNVDTDLTRFRTINPCGLDSAVMASIRSLGATILPHDTLVARLHHHIAAAFHRSPQ